MKRRLAAVALALCAAAVCAQTAPANCADQLKRRVVVTIGIGNYASWDHLTSPTKDADAVEELLKSQYGYTPYAKLVPGPKLRDQAATLDAINGVVDQLGKLLCDNDDLIFFYSGHGDYQPDPFDPGNQSKWAGYLIPVEAPAKSQQEWNKLLPVSGLMERLARLRARHILVILDACHSGIAIADSVHVPKAGLQEIKNDQAFMDAMETRRSRLVITAAGPGETADENSSTRPGNSLFTAVLLDELETKKPAGGHSFIDDSRLASELKEDVIIESGTKQHPDSGTLLNDQGGVLILPLNVDYDSLCAQAAENLSDGDLDSFQVSVTQLAGQQPNDLRTTYWKFRIAVEQGHPEIAMQLVDELSAAKTHDSLHLTHAQLRKLRGQLAFWQGALAIPPTPALSSPVRIDVFTGETEKGLLPLAADRTYSVPPAANLYFSFSHLNGEIVYVFVIDSLGNFTSETNIFNPRLVTASGQVTSGVKAGPDTNDAQEWHFLIASRPVSVYSEPPGSGDIWSGMPVSVAELDGVKHVVIRVKASDDGK